MRILNSGRIDLKPMVTHEIPMSRWLEGYELSRNGEAMKVVMHPQEG